MLNAKLTETTKIIGIINQVITPGEIIPSIIDCGGNFSNADKFGRFLIWFGVPVTTDTGVIAFFSVVQRNPETEEIKDIEGKQYTYDADNPPAGVITFEVTPKDLDINNGFSQIGFLIQNIAANDIVATGFGYGYFQEWEPELDYPINWFLPDQQNEG